MDNQDKKIPKVGEKYSIDFEEGQKTIIEVLDVRELYCTCKTDDGRKFDVSVDSFFSLNGLEKIN